MTTLSPTLARVLQCTIDAGDDEALVALQDLYDAARDVVRNWEHGDLAAAVSRLAEAIGA